MSSRKARHKVTETWRNGATFYDVSRRSWEDQNQEVVIRTFLTGADAYRWVEDIEGRHDALMAALDV